jgi:hypothetical protein
METDLELRRLAVADALRAIMAEPWPAREADVEILQVAPPEVSAPPVAVACALALAESGAAAAARAAEDRLLTEEWDAAELTERDGPMVPPLESVGSMSRMASLALFGHA